MTGRPIALWTALVICSQLLAVADAGGLFSASPTILKRGDSVPLYLNKIFSFKTQLPYAYDELSFICSTSTERSRPWINLGQVMRGDRIVESDYKVSFRFNYIYTLWHVEAVCYELDLILCCP